MKKINIVSAASFVFLMLTSAVAILMRRAFSAAHVPLLIGLGVLLVSGAVAFAVRERLVINIACFLVNSVAMGLLLRAWYMFRGFDNSFLTVVLVSLVAVVYLWFFFAITKIPAIHKSKIAYIITCVVYAVISVIVYCIVVAKTSTTFVSTFGYYMLVELAFIFALGFEVNSKSELMRNLTLSTFSIFLGVITTIESRNSRISTANQRFANKFQKEICRFLLQ
ncbi:MAG: hypothetical protein IJE25_05430 [Clostridia bacterium]|nr:hypothetical protein [Clostridia bacterium]